MDATDHELLRQFATHRSEDAFRRLVNRHVGLVFSVARRVTDDPQLAEEVAQTTFATLAQKAGELRPDDVPAGWLYHTARHLALRAVRSEQRRRQREHLAATMNTDEPGPSVVAEHLESAMDQLPPADRDALVLRYFEDRNLREVGHELGLTEDAARMRVNRALEKLRGVFGKLGITGSAAWLGTTLTTSATASVPAGLSATITTTVLAGTAVAAATTALITETTTTTMNLFNLKTAAAILGTAAVTGTTTYLVQEREAERLRADYQTLNETHGQLAAEQQEALAMIQLRDEQIERLKRDVADLPRLRGEVDRLMRELAMASRDKKRSDLPQEGTGVSSTENTRPSQLDAREKDLINNRLQTFFTLAIAGNTNAILHDLEAVPMEELSQDFVRQMAGAFVQEIVQGAATLDSFVIQDMAIESTNLVKLAVAFVDKNRTARIRDLSFVRAGEEWRPALFVGQRGVTFLSPHGVSTVKWESTTIPIVLDPGDAR